MDPTIIIFIVVGFIAQMIDGALGMAYGVSSNTFLLSLGIPPAIASASVHAAEIVVTAISGISHLSFGNVNKEIVKRLVIPGVIGGVVGAYILTAVPGDVIKPFIAIYLLIMGFVIILRAFREVKETEVKTTELLPLGLIGGFFDAIGGGGWGPIVTSTLVARGNNPRFSVGSVNFSEFFVTVAEVITFLALIGLVKWQIILGLLIGGVIAAPLAAYICKRLPTRTLMIMVGALIIILSIRTIYQTLF
ncbi:MAG: sulfite exporter TauE/SafE family protein [Anaerolineae bacterium]